MSFDSIAALLNVSRTARFRAIRLPRLGVTSEAGMAESVVNRETPPVESIALAGIDSERTAPAKF